MREIATLTCVGMLISAIYLGTKSLLLSMIMHWNLDAALSLPAKLFPDLKTGHDPLALSCALAVNLLLVALTVPTIVAIGRRDRSPAK